jgi:uncharacterized membrane protein
MDQVTNQTPVTETPVASTVVDVPKVEIPKPKKFGKLKTVAFWGGIASSFLIFIQSVLIADGHPLTDSTMVLTVGGVNSILSLLAASGILTNPEHVNSFQVMLKKIKGSSEVID